MQVRVFVFLYLRKGHGKVFIYSKL